MANTMVTLRRPELGSLAWDAVTNQRLFLQTVSSKLGPSLGNNSTSTSGPPEPRLKPSNREARPTGSLGPPGGRAVQPAGEFCLFSTPHAQNKISKALFKEVDRVNATVEEPFVSFSVMFPVSLY